MWKVYAGRTDNGRRTDGSGELKSINRMRPGINKVVYDMSEAKIHSFSWLNKLSLINCVRCIPDRIQVMM